MLTLLPKLLLSVVKRPSRSLAPATGLLLTLDGPVLADGAAAAMRAKSRMLHEKASVSPHACSAVQRAHAPLHVLERSKVTPSRLQRHLEFVDLVRGQR